MAIIIKLYTYPSYKTNFLEEASVNTDANLETLRNTIIPIRL